MLAETAAAAPGATGAPETTANNGDTNPHEEAPFSSMAASILEGEVPDEVREMVQPKEKVDDETDETEGAAPRGADDATAGRSKAEGQAHPKGAQDQGKSKVQPEGSSEEDEEKVTEEEKKSWPAEALNRIHKATAQKNAAKDAQKAVETERDQLREQLKQTAPIQVNPTAQNPLAHVLTHDALATEKAHFENLLQFASLNPEGITQIDPETGEPRLNAEGKPLLDRDYSAKEIAAMRYEAELMLREAIPARAHYIQQRQATDVEARTKYPEMFQKGTPENTVYANLREALPELERFVDPDVIVGNYIDGKKIDVARVNLAAGKPVPPNIVKYLGEIAELFKKASAAPAGSGRQPSDKVKPFLTPKPKMAPHVPQARTGIPSSGEAGVRERKQAEQKLVDSAGDEAAVEDYIGSLVNGSSREQAALV